LLTQPVNIQSIYFALRLFIFAYLAKLFIQKALENFKAFPQAQTLCSTRKTTVFELSRAFWLKS
jgi:hypothetical protein